MVDWVRGAVDAADHLTESDQASVALALNLAAHLDEVRESGDEARVDKATFGPVPTLHKILTSLGLNSEGKQKLGLLVAEEDVELF